MRNNILLTLNKNKNFNIYKNKSLSSIRVVVMLNTRNVAAIRYSTFFFFFNKTV